MNIEEVKKIRKEATEHLNWIGHTRFEEEDISLLANELSIELKHKIKLCDFILTILEVKDGI